MFTRRRTDFRFTTTGLVHHSDAGSQYTLLAFTDALPDSGIAGSIGSVGDALDNALMESAIGLYKTELIDRQKSWTGAPRSNVRPPAGCIGTTPPACTHRSGISHPSITRTATVRPSPPRRRWLNRGLHPDQDGSFIGIRT